MHSHTTDEKKYFFLLFPSKSDDFFRGNIFPRTFDVEPQWLLSASTTPSDKQCCFDSLLTNSHTLIRTRLCLLVHQRNRTVVRNLTDLENWESQL